METADKRRASFFTAMELEILIRAHGEFEQIFRKRSNTAVAAKERTRAWEAITDRVNA